MKTWQIAAVAIALLGLVTLVFVTPSMALPVGVSSSSGGSMGHDSPSLVVYADTEPEVGDVIVFKSENANIDTDWVRHRIVDETSEGFVTKGDANPGVDQGPMLGMNHVTEENIAGVVLFRVPLFEATAVWLVVAPLLGVTKYYRR